MLLGFSGVANAGGNADLSVFYRWLDDEVWSSADQQLGIGLNVDIGGKSWPVHIAGGYSYSDFNTSCTEGISCGFFAVEPHFRTTLSEWSLGAAKAWRPALVARPFLTGGVAFVFSEIEGGESTLSSRDSTQGFYASGGVRWAAVARGGASFNRGFEIRALMGTVYVVAGSHVSADYVQVGFIFGGGW